MSPKSLFQKSLKNFKYILAYPLNLEDVTGQLSIIVNKQLICFYFSEDVYIDSSKQQCRTKEVACSPQNDLARTTDDSQVLCHRHIACFAVRIRSSPSSHKAKTGRRRCKYDLKKKEIRVVEQA